jgi:FlaG/FlaF family flagellin (archaellin)
MGLRERFDDLGTGTVVALSIALAMVALVVAVALTVVVAAIIGTFVLGLGGSTGAELPAGATVQETDDGELSVVWTSNRNAEYLVVEWEAAGGNVTATGADGAVEVEDGRAELRAVGDAVRLSDGDPDAGTTVQVTATAVGEDGSRVVVLDREATA